MKKRLIWITVPVTIAVLLALAGCGGSDSSAVANNQTTSTPTVEEQPQNVDGNVSEGESAGSSTSPLDVHEVIEQVRDQLKMKDATLPTSFTLNKGTYLSAAILSNHSDSYKVNFYATTHPVDINDDSLTSSDSNVTLASYEVKDSRASDDDETEIFPEIDLVNIPKDMAVDLGHGIQGMSEGAAGSQYLTWKEGRWTLQIRSVSEDEMNNPGIAKKMVDYLESHTLPIPEDKGFINVQYASGGKSVYVTISWQEGSRIHHLTTDRVPLEALAMAVSVNA